MLRRRSAASSTVPDARGLRRQLGRKVSLRYALRDEPGFSSSELVGVLMSVDPNGSITVIDRRGDAHDVEIASIQALKVFPP